MQAEFKSAFPGVWHLTLGEPETHTPVKLRNIPPDMEHAAALPEITSPPFPPESIFFKQNGRGILVELPLNAGEDIYGFGLQLKSYCQTGKKKTIRVNSDPLADTGDSHAPAPFYLSTAGYGVFIDTARYATFYCGSHRRRQPVHESKLDKSATIGVNTEDIYKQAEETADHVMVEIPAAKGIDIYIFSGPSLRDALCRYIMFSGGGCLPPLWGLGIFYRGYAENNQAKTLELAAGFRDKNMPCSVFGLEPGWQSKAYSCGYTWSQERFPDPDGFITAMHNMGYEINLWEQLFVHHSAPFHAELAPYSGDFEVWNGLVPDFSFEPARKIFGQYHREQFIDKGIHGFKVDECDNSDFICVPWSFPEVEKFPGGMDGEQMHSMFGRLGQHALYDQFQDADRRTWSNCRSSHALAAPYPFVIYSDLYECKDFIRGVVTAGLSGILWTPEVRQCESSEELIRRIQLVIFSPMALINGWMIKNPPWLQYDQKKNNQDILMDNYQEIEDCCRKWFQLRMSLIPYFYSAFANYYLAGLPPFRAMVVDYPDDIECRKIDDQFMAGDNLLIAPLIAGQHNRSVYLPPGGWFSFFTNEFYPGGKYYDVEAGIDSMPVFVKNNSLLPLAEPIEFVRRDICFKLSVNVYGNAPKPFRLFADDGYSFAYKRNMSSQLELVWNNVSGGCLNVLNDNYENSKYIITKWTKVISSTNT